MCVLDVEQDAGTENLKTWIETLDDSSGDRIQSGNRSCSDMCNVSLLPKSPSNKKEIINYRDVWEYPSQITAVVRMLRLII